MNRWNLIGVISVMILNFLTIYSGFSQKETLKIFDFDSCRVEFIRIDGYNHIIYTDSTTNVVLFRETEEVGSELNELVDVKIRDNDSFGILFRKENIYSYVLFSLKDLQLDVSNMGMFEFNNRSINFKLSLLSYNILLKESLNSRSDSEILIYREDGYIQVFKAEINLIRNDWILNKKK